MLRNNLKIAFRNFSKRRLYSFINVLGLSMAFVFCMLVFLYTQREFSRDTFHVNADNMYQVNTITFKANNVSLEKSVFDLSDNEDIERSAYFPAMLGPLMAERIPEIKQFMRYGFGSVKIDLGAKKITENAKYVDAGFFEMFSFQLVMGDASTALNRPDKVAISTAMAEKYFGNENPIGQYLHTDNEKTPDFEVSAVFEKPDNSAMVFDLVFNYEQNRFYISDKDNWRFFHTPLLVELNPGADMQAINAKLDELMLEKNEGTVKGNRDRHGISEDNPSVVYRLVPLKEVYFNTQGALDAKSRPVYSLMLIGVALTILIIACINYVSISIATASARSTEIGIRKTIGASRGQLRAQLFVEVLLLTSMAGLLSYTGTQLLLPVFNELTGVSIVLTSTELWQLAWFTIAFVAVISLLTNIYPSVFMTRFKIMQSLSGRSTSQINPRFIQALVVFQFVMCIFFLSLSTTMHRQFQYISDKDLGYNTEGIIVMKGISGLTEKLRAGLTESPYINAVSGAAGIFTRDTYSGSLYLNGVNYTPRVVFTDLDIVEATGVELISGRSFSADFGADLNGKSCLVNEFYYDVLKQDSAFKGNANGMEIVGVIKDFHFDNLLTEIGPIYFQVSSPGSHSELLVNYDVAHTEEVMTKIEEVWQNLVPDRDLNATTMNDLLYDQYKQQRKWNTIINFSAVVGVLIACIGLFGLSGVEASNRTKEIGIRKVLGANLSSILVIMNKKTLILISAAVLIAFPISYQVMKAWLDGFAYKISVNMDLFLISGGICLFIVLLTGSYHSIKTAHINPSKLLRDE